MNKRSVGLLTTVIAFTIVVTRYWANEITRNCQVKYGFTPQMQGDQINLNGTKGHARVLCWILTGPENHMKRAIHVKRTWGSRCDKLLFMSSKRDERIGSIALDGAEEGHDKLWPKTQKAFQYIWKHHRDEADWILKADDDTYVLTDNMRDFLQNFHPAEAHYFGDLVNYGQGIPPVNFGGAGYILSKEATRLLVEVALVERGDCHTEIRKLYKGDEDTELGVCLASVGVKAEKTKDKAGRRRFNSGDPFRDMQKLATDDYEKNWENRPAYFSNSAISFHAVQPSQMYMLEYLTHNLASGNNSK